MTLSQICGKVKGKPKGFTYWADHMTETDRCRLIRMLQQEHMSVRVEDIMCRSTKVTVC